MNKQEMQGKTDTAVGRAKEAAGVLANDKALERAGERQQTRGKLRQYLGSMRQKIANVFDSASDSLKK